MIKSIAINNLFGIKKLEIDFTIKSINGIKTQEEQVIKIGKVSIPLIPTFIGMNASGKTSFLNSINFILYFLNKKKLERRIIHMKDHGYHRHIMRSMQRYNKSAKQIVEHTTLLSQEDERILSQLSQENKKIIMDLFNQYSFLGSEKSSVKLLFINDDFIEILLSPNLFIMRKGSSKIKENVIE